MIYAPNVMATDAGIQVILRFILRNLRGRNVGITESSIYALRRWNGVC
jgi:hypothetical protein